MTDETSTPATGASKPRKKASGTRAQATPQRPAEANTEPLEAMMLRHLRKLHNLTPGEARIHMGYGVPQRATTEQNERWDRITKIEAGE